jgi:hypothetical protein
MITIIITFLSFFTEVYKVERTESAGIHMPMKISNFAH